MGLNMFYPFIGALCFILSLVLLSGSGLIIFMHKAEQIKYTVRRGGWLVGLISAAAITISITAYCVYISLQLREGL